MRIDATIHPRSETATARYGWFSRELRSHWWIMASACAIWIAAAALEVTADGQGVSPRLFASMRLPEICWWRRVFDTPCPGCGLTRSFVHLSRGDGSAAWRSNRVGWLFAIAITGQIPYRLLALALGKTSLMPAFWSQVLVFGLLGALFLNWAV